MKLKLITAAVVLAASGQASATILGSFQAGGLGEATLNVWDPTTQNSYTQDLGLTWNELRTNLGNASYSNSFGIDATVFGNALGGSNVGDLIWNFSVADSQLPDFSNFTDFGVIGSSKVATPINTTALGSAVAAHDTLATAMLTEAQAGDNNTGVNAAYHGTVANGTYSGSSAIWGTNFKVTPINNTAGIGESMNVYYWQTGGFSPDPLLTEAAFDVMFDGSTLTLGAVSAVPVPAAAWLMGSGLLGLVGVARRKHS